MATVGHAFAQLEQCCAFDVRSTQLPLHNVGVFDGQPDEHAKPAPASPPTAEQTGVPPEHVVVQVPQWPACERSASHPSSGTVLQWANPVAHADGGIEHLPPLHETPVPETCGSFVQS